MKYRLLQYKFIIVKSISRRTKYRDRTKDRNNIKKKCEDIGRAVLDSSKQ